MSKENLAMRKAKPGILRRVFGVIGKFFTAVRWLVNTIFLLITVVILVSLFGQGAKPLPEQAALTLTPSGVLVEQRSYTDPLTQLMQQSAPYDGETPVRDLVQAIDHAAEDERITALVLDLGYLISGSISKLEEVGAALARFKQSGKPVVAISDNYTQQQYYLASFADEIHLNPMGGVLLTGYASYGTYLKSAADKLHINFHVFRAGDFKSAVEPFTRDDMSDEARDNTREWLAELWQSYTHQVELARGLDQGLIDRYIDTLHQRLAPLRGDMAALALDSGLVDRISTRPQMMRRLVELAGRDEDGYLGIPHKTYLSHLRPALDKGAIGGADHIGLIIASGTILDGDQPDGSIGGDSLAALLEQARKDDSLKALVVRIDSPGGSAFASEVIREQLLETRKTLPVIVSMGSLAASGGYWIAAGADEIWAMPTTLTGSIGVFGIFPTFERSLESMGIYSDGVGTTRLAGQGRIDRPLEAESEALIQLNVDHIYRRFVNLVAEGRNLTPEQALALAGGRIWTGRQALGLGLVDGLGTLDDAIASAAARAGLETWQVKPIQRPLSFQEQFLKQLAGSAVEMVPASLLPRGTAALPAPLSQLVANLSQTLDLLQPLHSHQGLYLQCFGCGQP